MFLGVRKETPFWTVTQMKNIRLHSIIAVVVLATLLPTIRAQSAQSSQDQGAQVSQDPKQRRIAIREAMTKQDGMHQAAKINGGNFYLSWSYSYGWFLFQTLESLAETADIGIVGTPISSEYKLADNGSSIITEYKIKVEEAIQGKVRYDDVVTVDLPGGRVVFDDGAVAEVEMSNFPRLITGHSYVLYLIVPQTLTTYQPLGGPEGIFELKTDGKVLPFATPQFTSAAKKDDDAQDFLGRVRVASGRQKRQ